VDPDPVVVSTGVPGYTSYQSMRQFHERVLPLRPDWIIVLSSNNECRARNMGDRDRGRWLDRKYALHRILGFSHFWLLVSRGPESLRRSWDQDPGPGRVANEPAEYIQNLRELTAQAKKAKCKVALATVPLRLEAYPIWKVYDELGPEARRRLTLAQRAAAQGETPERRRTLFERAVAAEPKQFSANWGLAEACRELNRPEEARRCYRAARDADLHPDAAKPAYNDVLRQLCNTEGFPLIDLENRFLESGLGEHELFQDHCHPTNRGHRLIAECIADLFRTEE
jgi:lysophospholipase L1-like esterase